jgi:hypothetical protein
MCRNRKTGLFYRQNLDSLLCTVLWGSMQEKVLFKLFLIRNCAAKHKMCQKLINFQGQLSRVKGRLLFLREIVTSIFTSTKRCKKHLRAYILLHQNKKENTFAKTAAKS